MRTNTFSYIICIKRKRRHADKEDPEEARDKKIRRVSRLEPYRKRIRFYFWPCHLPLLFFFLRTSASFSSSSSPCNGAFTHLYTHRLAKYACIVWAHVYPAVLTYSRVLRPFGRGARALYVPVRYFRYIHKAQVCTVRRMTRSVRWFCFDARTW